jgi:acyl-CoA reductase-like NAD-dependent aldehyde dehydrogenase
MKIKSINPATEEVMEEFRIVTHEDFSSKLKKARWSFTNWSHADVSEESEPRLPFRWVKKTSWFQM